ncbi:MAG: 2,3-bisphosphoglycerate-independent phosphoglycerate mutase [Candidatus Omnitrophota bacterium]
MREDTQKHDPIRSPAINAMSGSSNTRLDEIKARQVKPELTSNGTSLLKKLSKATSSKIILFVMDGVGGLPIEGKTELEHALKPNLDSLARQSVCGVVDPISAGITPGSGPAHLGLFGCDPLKYNIGRGVLEASGINFPLEKDDLAVRINFATIDKEGKITDRRAGRISTEINEKLCEELSRIKIDSVKIFVKPVKEHRAVVVFRGKNLSEAIAETDPQVLGALPLEPIALSKEAQTTSEIISKFVSEAKKVLAPHHPANMLLLRGFAKPPSLPSFQEIYRLNPAAIATYPMYKGLARLVGMKVLQLKGGNIEDEVTALEENYKDHDFFFIHIKGTDSAGEDGDWKRKVQVIENADKFIPRILKLKPESLVITGDHSTPSVLKSHSWHPVPILLYSPTCRVDDVNNFSETACVKGGLGRIKALDIMPLAMAHAQKLEKYGA